MPSPWTCAKHRTRLEDDAERGTRCPHCDAETAAVMAGWWQRVTAWIVRLATFTA